jgi:hypothetical protein
MVGSVGKACLIPDITVELHAQRGVDVMGGPAVVSTS